MDKQQDFLNLIQIVNYAVVDMSKSTQVKPYKPEN